MLCFQIIMTKCSVDMHYHGGSHDLIACSSLLVTTCVKSGRQGE